MNVMASRILLPLPSPPQTHRLQVPDVQDVETEATVAVTAVVTVVVTVADLVQRSSKFLLYLLPVSSFETGFLL